MLYHEKGLFIGTNFWWWFFCTSRGGFSIVWGFWNLILIKLVHLSVTIHVELNMSSKMYFKWPTYWCWKAVIFCPLFFGPYTRYYNVYFEVLSIVVMFLSRLAFKIHLWRHLHYVTFFTLMFQFLWGEI